MLSTLLILCVVIWVPIVIYFMIERGFVVLLIWLLIAPIAVNIIEHPSRNPLFTPEMELDYVERLEFEKNRRNREPSGYLHDSTSIKPKDVLEPTRLLFCTLALLLLVEKIYRNRQFLPLDRTEFWMIIFSVLLVVNIILQSGRVANGLKVAIDAFIVPFLAYAITRRFISSEARFQQFLWVLIGMGLYVLCIALVERVLHTDLTYRIKGPFVARNHFSAVVMAVFFMTLLAHLRLSFDWDTLRWAIRWSVLILAPLGIIATWTRSNWLGLMCGVSVLLLMARPYLSRGLKLVSIGLILLLLPGMLIAFETVVPVETVADRITNVNTIYARIGAWLLQLQEGIKHPILGIGFLNVRQLLGTQHIYVMGIKSETTSHNCFLAFFVELGLFGLFSYLAMVTAIMRTGLQQYREGRWLQDRWAGICMVSIWVAYLVPGLTSTMLYVPAISHVYIFACMGALAGVAGLDRVPSPARFSLMNLNRAQQVS
jgi:O-antigen ligase